MPEIGPLLPTAPGPQTPTSGTSGLSVAQLAADGSSLDFLGQLTAALKGLAAAVGPLPPAAGRAQTPAPPAPEVDSEPLSAESDPAPKVPDTDMNELPELLATLGLVVLPAVLQPVGPAAPDAVASAVVEPAPSTAASALPGPELAARPRQTTVSNDAPPTADDPTAPGPERPASPPPHLPAELETTAVMSQIVPQVSSPSAGGPEPHRQRATTPDANTAAPSAPPVVAGRIATPDRVDTPQAVSTSPVALIQAQSRQAPGPQSGDAGDGHEHRSDKTIVAVDSASTDSSAPLGSDYQAFNLAMAQASAPTGAPVPAAAVHASGVVSQIVHQAELYRLPGNRGVRIQLHPEDLGGVQVTVRYAAGGGLELHINAEHAATGALVQQGWTELRDALATQGISPDRLVMSVSSPESANQLDFSSSGGGSYRSDAGLAQFGQGGQPDRRHQQGAEGGLASRAWNGRFESPSATEQTVAASGAASRIDYRA